MSQEAIFSLFHKHCDIVIGRGGHGSVNHINRIELNRNDEMVRNNRTKPFKVWN